MQHPIQDKGASEQRTQQEQSPRSSLSSTSTPPFPVSPVGLTLTLPPNIASSYSSPSLHNRAESIPFAPLSPTLLGGELLSPTPSDRISPPAHNDQRTDTTQLALEQIFGRNPRPHIRSASLSAQGGTPRSDHPPEASPRSYFSPPLPAPPHHHRGRSQSSTSSDPVFAGRASPYRSSPPMSAHQPLSANSSNGDGTNPIRIGSRDEGARPRLTPFGNSYSSAIGGTVTLSPQGAGNGFDSPGGWRGSLPTPSQFSGWEDSKEAEREGRTRLREEATRGWGESHSPSDAGIGFSNTGIGLSNMSPFSRDSGRKLVETNDGSGVGYRARREYSLGAVGSGRKRGDTVWGSSRPLREAEDEDAEDAFAAPTKSGATSRRHSVSAFTAPSRSSIGFSLPHDEGKKAGSTSSGFGSGRMGGGSGFGSRAGSSAINDDDLAADLNSLHLNLEAHVAATYSSSSTLLPHVGSMPIYSGGLFSSSTRKYQQEDNSPPASFGSSRLALAQEGSRNGKPRFSPPGVASTFQPTTGRPASRFEFGGQQNDAYSQHFPSPFGRPASPPQSFYSGPLSAQAPAFQTFVPPSQQQQQQSSSSFYSTPAASGEAANLGRGVPLSTVPANAPLYIVEFKAGRKDLFFVEDPNITLRQGDLVIVEADRGKDIGKFFKPCSLDEVQAFQQRLVELALGQLANPTTTSSSSSSNNNSNQPPNAATIARMTKEFSPKKIFGKALPIDTQLLLSKAQDEVKALALVRSKVAQKSTSLFPSPFFLSCRVGLDGS